MINRYFFLSLFLHSLLILLLFLGYLGGGSSKTQNVGINFGDTRQIIPKTVNVQIISHKKGIGEIKLPVEKKNKKSIKKCKNDDWFGGIGIMESLDGIITYVYSGYPASKAGLLPGDRIVSVNNSENFYTGHIRGTPGTVVRISVIRNGKKINFYIIRGKICVKG